MPGRGDVRIQSDFAVTGLGSKVPELLLLAGLEVEFGGGIPASVGPLAEGGREGAAGDLAQVANLPRRLALALLEPAEKWRVAGGFGETLDSF